MPETLRTAVVGLIQGLEDVYTTLNHPRHTLVAVCDIDRRPWQWLSGDRDVAAEPAETAVFAHHRRWVEEIRRHPDFSAVTFTENYDKILDRADIDAVVLVLPDRLHREFTVRALERGKYVLATKPMALTIGEAFDIAHVAQGHPNHFMLGYQLTYGWFAQQILRIVQAGDVGTPRLVRFDFHRGPWRPVHKKKHAPIDGAMVKEGGHWLDLFYRISGQRGWQTMTGLAGLDKPGNNDFEFEDNGALVIDYGGFRVAHGFSYFRQPHGRSESFALIGEEGSISGTFNELTLETDDGVKLLTAPPKVLPYQFHAGYFEMHDAFTAMALDDVEPYTNWRTGLENVLTSYASEIALSENRSIRRSELIGIDWRHRPML